MVNVEVKLSLEHCRGIFDLSESPIETQFAWALIGRMWREGVPVEVVSQTQAATLPPRSIVLIPQYRWLGFRWDFALGAVGTCGRPLVLIECDGQQFHTSPEQIENDRIKDRTAIDAGVKLLRFGGAAIFTDPHGCADDVMHTIVALARK